MQNTFQKTQPLQPQGNQQVQAQQQQTSMRPTWQQSLQQINALLTPAKEVVVVMRPTPTFDTLAASLSLSSALKKIGRRSNVICPQKIDTEKLIATVKQKDRPKHMPGIDQILDFLPQKQLNLVIDYINGSFSTGDMEKSDKGLVLTLAPEEGQKPIEPLNIDSHIYESQIDVAFTIGIENLSHLQDFYQQHLDFFNRIPIVNIDYHKQNSNYGRANLIDSKASSLSEVTTLMLYDLRFIFDQDIAKMLYAGIKSKTDNFSQEFYSANMLEATSICLRYQQPLPKPQF